MTWDGTVGTGGTVPGIGVETGLALYLLSAFVFTGVLPVFYSKALAAASFLIQSAVAVYFFSKRSPLAGPSAFLAVLLLTFLAFTVPSVWVFNLAIAISIYLAILFSSERLRRDTGWLKAGSIDKTILLGILAVVILSSTALVAWHGVFRPDLATYEELIPDVGTELLLLVMVSFAFLNGIAEEVMFRGIFYDGLDKALDSVPLIIIIQGAFFGLCHYKGFPGGPVGVVLASIYGALLGALRHRSQGLLAPMLAHIFADITISAIILKAVGRI